MDFSFGVMRAPAAILFGSGHVKALGRQTATIGKRALICTDERFAQLPLMETIVADLAANGVAVAVFDGTLAELPLSCIEACAAAHADFAPEVIIGLGGGSCIDMAKLVSLALTHGFPLSRFYGEFKVPGPIVPVIAVPTTAGTGSEMTPVAVLGDDAAELKVGVASPYLIPRAAICDPELTLSCPKGLTAVSGADALTHAIEAFTAVRRDPDPQIGLDKVFVGKNELSDHFALKAIPLIMEGLPRAVRDGNDLAAREALMLGAALAGLAFGAAGTSAAHAIQYPVGALTHTAHGLGVGVLLPHAMDYNMPVSAKNYAAIARGLGIDGGDHEAAEALVARIRALFDDIGLPDTIADLGIRADQLDWIAERTLLSARLVNNNPRPLDQAGIRSILDNAFARPQADAPVSKDHSHVQ